MTGHSKWDPMKPASPRAREDLQHYCRGYELAMNDILDDIEELESESFEDRDSVYYEAITAVKAKVMESLKSCESTLEVLRDMQ